MKRLLCVCVLAASAIAAEAADIGVSVSIGIPGVYGYVQRGPVVMYAQPTYLYPAPEYHYRREYQRPQPHFRGPPRPHYGYNHERNDYRYNRYNQGNDRGRQDWRHNGR